MTLERAIDKIIRICMRKRENLINLCKSKMQPEYWDPTMRRKRRKTIEPDLSSRYKRVRFRINELKELGKQCFWVLLQELLEQPVQALTPIVWAHFIGTILGFLLVGIGFLFVKIIFPILLFIFLGPS